ncbi:hypothetical protein FQN51_005304 [Onygenales sp. PD_10]|nr:hypothetical protein FQN51_005304 [Onygenales sp. PD_10]
MPVESYPPQLTVLERLDLFHANLSLIATAIYASLTGVFRGKDGSKYYKRHVGHAIMRTALPRLSTRQNQYLSPSTDKTYEAFAKSKGFSPETIKLEHGGLGHWIGNKDAKNVLIYFHGGGFSVSAGIAYYQVFSEIINTLNAEGKDIALFFLTYTLTPHAIYPTQLKQAVAAVRYITDKTPRNPSNVFLGGDSAGGNLVLGILSHISHPHKAIEPLEVSEPFAGALAISPWVSFSLDFPSVKYNQYKDMLSREILQRWSSQYIADLESDNYLEPLRAPAEWWKDIMVKDVLIVTGSDDLFVSAITEFVEKFKTAFPSITFVIGPDEPHDGPIICRTIGDKTETVQGKAFSTFLSSRL